MLLVQWKPLSRVRVLLPMFHSQYCSQAATCSVANKITKNPSLAETEPGPRKRVWIRGIRGLDLVSAPDPFIAADGLHHRYVKKGSGDVIHPLL